MEGFHKEAIRLPLSAIGDRYGSLRMIHPRAESFMVKSLSRYGQLSPVVVCPLEKDRYEMVDGFKRLRAGRQVSGVSHLEAKRLEVGSTGLKAAILQLNWLRRSVSDMDEALVVRSLYRDDCLSQVEIGTLLDRHKSWVSRRIGLIERLCEEGQESVKLGLISASVARELSKLPRGNQEAALGSVVKHKLTRRETEQVVSALMIRPKSDHEEILRAPESVLANEPPVGKGIMDNGLGEEGRILYKKLIHLERSCLSTSASLGAHGLSKLQDGEALALSTMIGQTIRSTELVSEQLKNVLSLTGSACEPPISKPGREGE